MSDFTLAIAQAAAPLVVEEGLAYGPAKRRALKNLGITERCPLPSNAELELAVQEYLALFGGETQQLELAALRRLALMWMERLLPFRPFLSGTVWHGTANHQSDIYLQLFCDDPKSAEFALIDQGVDYEPGSSVGLHGQAVGVLSVRERCADWADPVVVHLLIYDHDDLRGALRPDDQGRSPRGNWKAVKALLDAGCAHEADG